eukprot:scaffold332_cov117-Cylindrotheca_fusiformis.AAC.32
MLLQKLSRIAISILVGWRSVVALQVRILPSNGLLRSRRTIPTIKLCILQCQLEPKSEKTENFSPTIPILYESNRILIVDKPPGISHHDDGDEASGIVSRIRAQQGERLWGVHRLDKVTSGILIFAKDTTMASLLSNAFAEGAIQKFYVGISAKLKPKKKQGLVQGGMSRSRDKSWKLNRNPADSTKNFAKTRFFSVKLSSEIGNTATLNNKYTCILFRPYTGRTHQLRVAAKAMGIALLGDPIYKDGQGGTTEESTLRRTYLHAAGISIPSLDGEDEIYLWHPPPFDNLVSTKPLQAALEKLMKKHCDVPGILGAMNVLYWTSTQNICWLSSFITSCQICGFGVRLDVLGTVEALVAGAIPRGL